MTAEARLAELGYRLLAAPPLGHYVRAVTTGNLVYTAGHGPSRLRTRRRCAARSEAS